MWPTLCNGHLSPAFGGKSIASAVVYTKILFGMPPLAICTPFFASLESPVVFVESNPDTACCNFLYAKFASHNIGNITKGNTDVY